jgi:hypothetical protein
MEAMREGLGAMATAAIRPALVWFYDLLGIEQGARWGQEFARHFGTKLGTPKPAVFALEAATSVRSSSLFEPMMRTSFPSTSTR